MENCRDIKVDPEFYGIDKTVLLEFKPIDRRLSCNFLDFEYEESEFYKKATDFIIKNFYSLFAHITNEITPCLTVRLDTSVSFNGNCNNMIQLGLKLLSVKGYRQQLKTDSLFATMIHEMFHKRYTNADISRAYITPSISTKEYYESKQTAKLFDKLFKDRTHSFIFNILEDKRIERLGIKEFPGYVFYFDRKREYAIELHKGKVVNVDMLPHLLLDYLMFVVLMPELRDAFMGFIDQTFKAVKNTKFSKKGILDVIGKFDVYMGANAGKVYSDDVKDVVEASTRLFKLIPKNMSEEMDKDLRILKDKGAFGIGEDSFFGDGREEDEGYTVAFDELAEQIEESTNKFDEKNTAEKKREERLNIIDASDGIYEHVTIYNPICKRVDAEIYDKAKRMSQDISRSLGFISSRLNQINHEFELTEGELDEDELYSIGYSREIFYDEEPKAGFEFDFGILIDESGSMSRKEKIKNATIAALGCILSTKDSKHVNLFVYGHSQGRHVASSGVELYEYFNSKRHINDWRNVFSAGASGSNADGYAIAKLGEIMLRDSKTTNKIIVVISDGLPEALNYSGISAERHVRSVVDMLEGKGIETVQICIDNIDKSKYMFKNYIPYDNMGDFIDKFRNILRNKLIKFSENL